MDTKLLQDLINVLSYAIASRGEGVPELLEILKYEFDDPNLIENHPDEVRSAFGSAMDGEMYQDYLAWEHSGERGVVRSSLDGERKTMRIKLNELRRTVRKVLLEFGENDAQLRQKLQNREKMIGIGMDGGTIGFNPDWDYDTKPASSKKRGIMGDVIRQVASRLENHPIGEWMEAKATNNPNVIRITSGDMAVVVTDNYGEFTFEMKAPRKWRGKWQETCYSIDAEIDEVLDSLDDWVQTTEMMEMGEG